MTALTLVMVSIALSAVGCSSGKAASSPLAPRVYLDNALELMRAHAVYGPAGGWSAVRREAHRMAAGAKTPGDTYGAIIYALDQLRQGGDLHSDFTNPLTAKLRAQGAKLLGTTPTPPPTVSLLNGRVGLIDLPAIASPPESPNARRYASSALSRIAKQQDQAHPCGWIVDLRTNGGGDMYPMLFSVGPILGDGRPIGFIDRTGSRSFVSYRDGTLSGDGFADRAPTTVANITPAPPVAVLTGPATASSGEAVAIAFRGRRHTRSFGASTAGAPNSPHSYRLADGAAVRVSVAWDVDRHGNVYKRSIEPDVVFPRGAPRGGTLEAAAEKWLMAAPACSR